ncbi:hypothetical protein N7L95_10405 [Eleftheria terrae]|nr:hypothetical protein N7L95_10405 [Eleftheria terrae]
MRQRQEIQAVPRPAVLIVAVACCARAPSGALCHDRSRTTPTMRCCPF